MLKSITIVNADADCYALVLHYDTHEDQQGSYESFEEAYNAAMDQIDGHIGASVVNGTTDWTDDEMANLLIKYL